MLDDDEPAETESDQKDGNPSVVSLSVVIDFAQMAATEAFASIGA